VNADDPEMRQVAYGDERGSRGSIVTFFDMPGVKPGRPGAGMVHRLLVRVAGEEALDFWERRLARAQVPCDRLADRLGFSDVVAENDRVGSISVWDGTVTQSGRAVDFTSADFFRIEDGLAAEDWDTVDYVRLYQSFGLLPDDVRDG
jgi:catechol 2,3-dioxygenase-like lactoylglutathione lyase family enzyme